MKAGDAERTDCQGINTPDLCFRYYLKMSLEVVVMIADFFPQYMKHSYYKLAFSS